MSAVCPRVLSKVSWKGLEYVKGARTAHGPSRSCVKPTWRRTIATLTIDRDALMNDIHHTCQWGTGERWGKAPTETGMSRLALSDTDKQAREWFASTTSALGCKVSTDAMGNQFAIRAGKKPGPPTVAGSHLDTQPTGGRYDGILGVTAGVAMLRALEESKTVTDFPVGVVNWTNEEGARFPISMVSSGVWAGEIPLENAHNLASVVRTDPPNTTMKTELERIGYLGQIECSHRAIPLAAHFELHIEQGPQLEKSEQKVGIVEGVQAYRWFTITVKGRDCHTGTTALVNRADALLAAAKMIVKAREESWKHGGLASTGIIEARPGSTNTVPGHVKFSLDIRSKKNETVNAIENALRKAFEEIAAAKESKQSDSDEPRDVVSVEWRQDSDSPAVNFHDDCIDCVTNATKKLFGEKAGDISQRMVSGAGHDSVYASKRVPTSMIFVPCRHGVSHNPREFTTPEDCTIGAQVLMDSVLGYDSLRSQREA